MAFEKKPHKFTVIWIEDAPNNATVRVDHVKGFTKAAAIIESRRQVKDIPALRYKIGCVFLGHTHPV